MKDLMVDIETLDSCPTAVIVQIGACYFDRYTGEIGEIFLQDISPESCIELGLTMSWPTIKWWFDQSKRTWMQDGSPLSSALLEFTVFCAPAEYVWSHATFDAVILANAYGACQLKPPFHYRGVRDIRTLTDLGNDGRNSAVTFKKPKTERKDEKTHNALEDCVYQVEYCVKCFNALRQKES